MKIIYKLPTHVLPSDLSDVRERLLHVGVRTTITTNGLFDHNMLINIPDPEPDENDNMPQNAFYIGLLIGSVEGSIGNKERIT